MTQHTSEPESVNTAPAPPPTPAPSGGGSGGPAVASLVLGIIGLLFSFLLIGVIPALAGLVLGTMVIARKGKRQELAAVGAGLSGCGLLIAATILVVGGLALAGVLFAPDKAAQAAQAAILAVPDHTGEAAPARALAPLWTHPAGGAVSADAGDWNGDGAADLVVLAADRVLCLDAAGAELGSFPLEQKAPVVLRCGDKGGSLRVAVLSPKKIGVYDAAGRKAWEHGSLLELADLRWMRASPTDDSDSLLVGVRMLKGVRLLSPDGAEVRAGASPPLVYTLATAPDGAGGHQAFVCSSPGITLLNRRAEETGILGVRGFMFSLAAAAAAPGGPVRVLALGGLPPASLSEMWNPGGGMALALDTSAKTLWRCPAKRVKGAPRPDLVASGDFDGDGRPDWVIPGEKELLLLTDTGRILCRTGIPQGIPVALPRPGAPDLLAVVDNGAVAAYELAPAAP